MSYRRAAAAFGPFCALAIMMAGCSSGGTGQAGTGQAGTAATGTAAAATATPGTIVVVQGSKSRPSATGRSGLTVTISGLPARLVLTPGGPSLEFTVNIKNGTRHAFSDITPVVAMEHCTCVSAAAQPAPAGILQEYVLATGKWRTVSYDRVGTGTAYLNVVEQVPVTLNPGATLSFTFRVRLRSTAHQPLAVHAGQTGLVVAGVRLAPGGPATAGAMLATVRVKVPVEAG